MLKANIHKWIASMENNEQIHKMMETVRHIIHRKYKFAVTQSADMQRIGGNRHGSYAILPEALPPRPVMFSFGLGDDIEAEKLAAQNYHCMVYGFDPTPRVKKWMEENIPENNFEFHNIALTTYDGEAEFYFPENDAYISGSIYKGNVGWQKISDRSTKVKCNKLSTLMNDMEVDRIDYLKLCVEGGEYEVVENILSEELNVIQIAVALCGRDLKSNYDKDKKLYQELINHGYQCLPYYSDDKITFIKR